VARDLVVEAAPAPPVMAGDDRASLEICIGDSVGLGILPRHNWRGWSDDPVLSNTSANAPLGQVIMHLTK